MSDHLTSNRDSGEKTPKRLILFMEAFFIFAVIMLPGKEAAVFAAGKIHFGRWQIIPGIEYEGIYHDNIHYEHKHEKPDFIHRITPSLKVRYPGVRKGNLFQFGYQNEISRYARYGNTDYENHQAFLDFHYRSPVGLYLKLHDDFQHTADPYGTTRHYTISDRTADRWNNTFKFLLGYEFGRRYSVELTYANFVHRFDRYADYFEERTENAYGLALIYALTPKTAVFGEFRHTDLVFPRQNAGLDFNPDWDSHNSQDHRLNEALVGVRFDPTGKLRGEARMGFQDVSFENHEDRNGNEYNADSAYVVEVDIEYDFRPKTTLLLGVGRSREVSYATDLNTDVAATYFDNYIRLGLEQQFKDKFTLKIGYQLNYYDYLDEKSGVPAKDFLIQEITSSLDYNIQEWLKVGVFYSYKRKKSSDLLYKISEYDVNQVGLRIKLEF